MKIFGGLRKRVPSVYISASETAATIALSAKSKCQVAQSLQEGERDSWPGSSAVVRGGKRVSEREREGGSRKR